MKVLCICSQNGEKGISPVIHNQINALVKQGVDFDIYGIKGKGVRGYFRAIFSLRKFLKNNFYPVYHAHYGLSAIVATLAGVRPLIVSLMGSDVKEGGWQQWLIKRFVKHRWALTIVKSQELADIVGSDYCKVIPNGVDMSLFKPMPMQECREKLNLEQNKKYVLFAANPGRPEKNFALTKSAFGTLSLEEAELIYLQNVPHSEIPLWMNAADAVVISSLWEGSPNVIKEAMACCRPIVSSNVGDVSWLLKNVKGCFIANHTPKDFAAKLKLALEFGNKTDGRKKLEELHLDSVAQANAIKELYAKHINEHANRDIFK